MIRNIGSICLINEVGVPIRLFPMSKITLITIAIVLFTINVLAQASQPSTDDLNNYFKPVKWRSIGPFRGGRSVAGTGVIGDTKTYYMGTTGGGLWKTSDMGITSRNISDGFFKTATIGAIAVAESDPTSFT